MRLGFSSAQARAPGQSKSATAANGQRAAKDSRSRHNSVRYSSGRVPETSLVPFAPDVTRIGRISPVSAVDSGFVVNRGHSRAGSLKGLSQRPDLCGRVLWAEVTLGYGGTLGVRG